MIESNIECTPILSEYYRLQNIYNIKYGNRTVILFQKGTFYEIYEYCPNDDGTNYINTLNGNVSIKLSLKSNNDKNDDKIDISKKIGQAINVSLLLKIKLTSIDSNKPHSINNPYMAGIPKIVYIQHRDVLLLNGYTIIRVDENGKKDGIIHREVVEIASPGTEIESMSTYIPKMTNGLVCLYLEYVASKNIDKTLIVCGLSYIDNTTSENSVYESYSKDNDENYVIQEIYRYLGCKRPAEIIIYMNKYPIKKIEEYKKYYIDQLELTNYTKYYFYYDIDAKYANLDYQERYLTSIFDKNKQFIEHSQKIYTIIDKLELSKFTYGRISYIALLSYIYEHNNNLLKSLPPPLVEWFNESENLILTNNTTYQLNLCSKDNNISSKLSDNSIDSLVKILDHCKTNMGSRFLYKRLTNPITSVEKLNICYSITRELINNHTKLTDIAKLLSNIDDIERLQRILLIDMIKPYELYKLLNSYNNIISLYDYLNNDLFNNIKYIFPDITIYNQFISNISYLNKLLNLISLKNAKLVKNKIISKESFINNNFYPAHDNILNNWNIKYKQLQNICDHFNIILPKSIKNRDISINFDTTKKNEDDDDNDNINIYISTSNTKANKLINNSELNINLTGNLNIVNITKTNVMIKSNIIDNLCEELERYHYQLELQLYQIYNDITNFLKQQTYMNSLTKFVMYVDFLYNNAKLAISNNYYEPTILYNDNSYFEIKEMRHPIIEKIIKNEYICNDITIGNMLLYGINSCGKSSLLKSVGLIIIMAQAGLYVPGYLKFTPYHRILVRLSGNDDIFKGKSSYIIELEELKSILRYSDNHSLVLIDELCKGSERDSAIALTVATILELVERNSTFILTSHIHELLDIDEIKNMNNLQVKHLSVSYDKEKDLLIYGRKLLDGQIDKLYGIEVAKSLNFEQTFLDKTINIRNKLVGSNIVINIDKTSHFNNDILVNNCYLCKSKINLETHHINEQHLADSNNMIGYYHKNSSFNLIVLCKNCHNNLHHNNSSLQLYQTLNGSFINS